MSRAFKIESTVVVNGASFARATAIASRLSSAAYGLSSEGKKDLAKETRQLANSYYGAIETGIAKATGAKKIKEQSGRGLQVDLISVDLKTKTARVAEVKGSLIQSIIKSVKGKNVLNLSRKSSIGLGSAIKIGSQGQSVLTTGYSVGADGSITEQVETLTEVEKFVKLYSKDNEKLRAHLKAPSKQRNKNLRKILEAVRLNLETKALTLTLPFSINKQQTGITTLKFTREFLLNNANIAYSAETDTIDITFSYPQKVLNDALSLAAKDPAIKKATNRYDTNFAGLLAKEISKIPKDPTKLNYFKGILLSLEKELNSQEFSADINFFKGSVLAYKGLVKVSQDRKEDLKQSAIPPIIDITTLVQGRTKLRMRRGSGEPYPPKIYERTGTFRGSIEAYADFRTNTLNYYYAPYYDSLEKYGYQIQDLVEGSIRSITQQYFNRQFNLVRTNT